jgi:hypothetical protein
MAKPARSLNTLPELAGWLTFGEAAVKMGISVERVRQLATNGRLETAHRLGLRPIGIVREAEINRWKERKQEQREEAANREQEQREEAAHREQEKQAAMDELVAAGRPGSDSS